LNTELNIEEAVKNADLILHLTEWKDYRNLDPEIIGNLVRQKIIIDGRNVLDENLWRKSGWKVSFLGKPSS
jgi:UDPglucose 6-dehydrogenase